jgi:acetyl esterase/lipase
MLLWAAGSLPLLAQKDTLYLWPNAVPGLSSPKAKPVQSILDDGSQRVVQVSNPFMEVFEPAEHKRNGKAMLVIPGGGYTRLAAVKEGHATALMLNSLGYTAFVLQYRVPNQREGAQQDSRRAMRLIRALAKKYRVDGTKVAAIGFSAGAHLVALAAMAPEVPYQAQDSADALSGSPDRMVIIYPGFLSDGPNRSLSPNLKPNKDTVPTFIYQTADDRSAPSSLALTQALFAAGANVELHLLPIGGHGYGLYPGLRAAEAWPVLLAEWLKVYY